MQLTLGKKTGKELAEWFGISPGAFRNGKEKKLEELKYFAEFYEENGKVVITKILNPIYQKRGSEAYQKVVNKIDEVWSKDGLDSCSRVGTEICEILSNEDKGFKNTLSTVIEYTRKGRKELYGVPFQNGGRLGNCIYIWCKRDKNSGAYSFLTDDEIEIKEQLQKKYFGDATEKQILVKGMVESGEISKEDAWDILEELTNMKTGNFMMFLKELQERLGCQVIKGTYVERNNMIEFKEGNNGI